MQCFDVAGYHLRGLVKGVAALGMESGVLLRDAQIDRAVLDDPEARFPEEQLLALWMLAERQHAGPAFGLTLATHVPFGALELVDYLIGASSSVGAGMQCLEHQAKLCASGFYFRIGTAAACAEPTTSVWLEHRHGVELLPASLIEYVLALVIHRFRALCGATFCPKLSLRSGPAGPAPAYRAALGQVPERGSSDAIHIDALQWTLANPRHDPLLSSLLSAHARDVSQRIPERGFAATALATIAESLRMGDPAIHRVAARLGLTARTLQRRLNESLGRSFQDLVEQTRRELALRYLRDTQHSLAEISGLLAYSEPSAFGRAFQRWTGTTPAAYRRGGSGDSVCNARRHSSAAAARSNGTNT